MEKLHTRYLLYEAREMFVRAPEITNYRRFFIEKFCQVAFVEDTG